MTKAVVFDLDGTLYDAQQYFWGAFGEISGYISEKYGLSQPDVFQALVQLWQEKTSMYPRLFDDLITLLHLRQEELEILIRIFNEHRRKMEPYPDVIPALKTLRGEKYKLGLITDGNVERQQRKLQMLDLEHYFDTIIYAQEVEPKPSSLPFAAALSKLKVPPEDTFYIADNPLIDFKGAREAGMHTIRILQGEFASLSTNDEIDFEITGLNKLLEIVKK